MRKTRSTRTGVYCLCAMLVLGSGCSSTLNGSSPPLDTDWPEPTGVGEFLGLWTGALISPIFGLGSLLRQDRVFHPRGGYFTANVRPAPGVTTYKDLAQRLSGLALVRLSAGLWRTEHEYLPDVLGFTIRFSSNSSLNAPDAAVQDLLLVTARSPWTLLIDSVRTNQSSFLINPYFGMSPFSIDGEAGYEIRVLPHPEEATGDTRYERIRNLVAEERASFLLEIAAETAEDEWLPVVVIELTEEQSEVNESDHLFWPFRDGLGIEPRGFVHYLRAVPYIVSLHGRNLFDNEEVDDENE